MLKKLNFAFYSFFVSVLVFIVLSVLTESCADNPSSLGIKFINPAETLGVKTFDSYVDTMQITTSNVRLYINTSSSTNLIVGKNASYNSMGLIKFTGLPSGFDTATVRNAVLKLKYRNYYYPVTTADSLGTIAFDVYKVQQNFNYSGVTYDSINSTSFGNVSQGNYSGAPAHDSVEADITLNNTLVHDWLKYTTDTSYSVKNYGVVLTPNNGSTTLKSFYSGTTGSSASPLLQITFTSNSDTLNITASQTVFLATTTITTPKDEFCLQAGISYVDIIKFNTSKLSPQIIVNDARVIFTIDPPRSVYSNQTNYSITGNFVTDTSYNFEPYSYIVALSSNQFSMRIISPFQRWIQGQNNYGMILRCYNEYYNLDLFSIFKETASDPSKRPRVIIKYSQRVP